MLSNFIRSNITIQALFPQAHSISLPKVGQGLGWVGVIRKVYEVDPLGCPTCVGQMSVISFIEETKAIDRIIRHLELTFEAERPPPPHQQGFLMAAEESGERAESILNLTAWRSRGICVAF